MVCDVLGGVSFSLPIKSNKREMRRQHGRWIGTSASCCVDGKFVFESPHCCTKFQSTGVASESSTSGLLICCDVSAKLTTLACFHVACDTAMLLSVALAMCVRGLKALLRV